jgi:hypothetical protein
MVSVQRWWIPTLIQTREFYRSASDDSWLLTRDSSTGKVSVQHQANLSSGGRRTEIELGTFLSRDSHSAENQALRRLIGTLVENE